MSDADATGGLSATRVLAWTLTLVAGLGSLAWSTLRWPPPEAPRVEPDGAQTVTDVSDWLSRETVRRQGEVMVDLGEPGVDPLIDRCGSRNYNRESSTHETDEVRYTYFAAWGRGSFSVVVDRQRDGAIATWAWFALDLKSERPSDPDGSRRSHASTRVYAVTAKATRLLDDMAWQRAMDAVNDPEFARLVPGAPQVTDSDVASIESCTAGRYHLVRRTLGREEDAFRRTVERLQQAVGAMPGEAERVVVDGVPEA